MTRRIGVISGSMMMDGGKGIWGLIAGFEFGGAGWTEVGGLSAERDAFWPAVSGALISWARCSVLLPPFPACYCLAYRFPYLCFQGLAGSECRFDFNFFIVLFFSLFKIDF